MRAQPSGPAPLRSCHRPAPPSGHRRAANPTAAPCYKRPSGEGEDDVEVGHRRSPSTSNLFGSPGRGGRRPRPWRRCPATCETSTDKHGSDGSARVKFKGLITKSLLCVRCKAEGALRAVRAQCAYPVLSAKRRHQLRHVYHRVGGAEHLWQHRQSARGDHEGSATAGPLRLVRVRRRDGWARDARGTRIPWLTSMVQRPDGPRESARREPPYLGKSSASHLNMNRRR